MRSGSPCGGLGDVVFGLGRELELRGNAVEIVLPQYDCLRYERIYGLTVAYEDLWVPWYSGAINCTVWFGFVDGRKCYFVEPKPSSTTIPMSTSSSTSVPNSHTWCTRADMLVMPSMFEPCGLAQLVALKSS